MSAMNDLHRRAMDKSALALMERMRGNSQEAMGLFEQALELELAAIAAVDEPVEPTFSVLHRSAATLALDCNQPRQAEKLVAIALAHDPPLEIADELRDLWEQINFHRHLELRGIELGDDEMQLSLSGAEVGFGFVRAREFQKRADDSARLIYRIAERRSHREFRERGDVDSLIKDQFEPYYSLPRAASYSVTLRFGHLVRQLPYPGMMGAGSLDTTRIIDEFMDLMKLVQDARIEQLRERIPQPAYLRNFLSLARNLAPDGRRIRQVGFTTTTNTGRRSVSVITPASKLPLPKLAEPSTAEAEPVEIHGILRFADSIRRNQIKIIDRQDRSHTIDVPDGMMNDIVRPLWDLSVTVTGLRKGKSIVLEDIQTTE